MKAAGAEVDYERIVPELSGRAQSGRTAADAILDLYVTFPGSTQRYLVDVTVRSPHAQRYIEKDSHLRVGVPSTEAASEKVTLYGTSVLAVPFESYGRLGAAGHATLGTLASAASSAGADQASLARFATEWRGACETAMLFAQADVALLALGARATLGLVDQGALPRTQALRRLRAFAPTPA